MRLVDRPYARPFHDCALPHIGQTNPSTQWIATGSTCGVCENVQYLTNWSTLAAMQALGWPTPGEFQALRVQLQAANEQNTDLNARLAEAERQLEAVHVLKQAGFQAERKRGPKAREGAVA